MAAHVRVPLDICYGSLSFFTSILHNIFLLYHVDMFVSIYKINKLSFWLGETVFLVWNSLNDPLFGWLSDRHYLSPPATTSTPHPSSDSACDQWQQDVAKQENTLQNQCTYSTLLHNEGGGLGAGGVGDEKQSPTNEHGYTNTGYRRESRQWQQSHPKSEDTQHTLGSIVLHRLDVLAWNGPMLAVSFALFWVSWLSPGLQFVICLCLYDSFLTSVDLQHDALLADLAISADARTRLNARSSIFSAFGSASVFVSYAVWNRDNLTSFRIFCLVVCIVSIVGFYLGTKLLRLAAVAHFGYNPPTAMKTSMFSCFLSSYHSKRPLSTQKSTMADLKTYIRQLSSHRNFWWFTLMNLVQVFHCHFNSNFFPLFLDILLGANSTSLGALLLGVSFVFPHINNIYFLSLCRRYGVYRIVLLMFTLKFLLTLVMYSIGSGCVWAVCVYIASNRVFTEGTCRLLTLVVSDLVDEDCVLHGRPQPVSALIFGTAALLSKPGQTLAPLLGTWMLTWQTGHDLFTSSSREVRPSGLGSDPSHRVACFNLLVYVPMVCASFQMVVWLLKFSLHGHRLQWVKAVRSGAAQSGTV